MKRLHVDPEIILIFVNSVSSSRRYLNLKSGKEKIELGASLGPGYCSLYTQTSVKQRPLNSNGKFSKTCFYMILWGRDKACMESYGNKDISPACQTLLTYFRKVSNTPE